VTQLCAFVALCLQKEPEERPTAVKLLEHPFITKYAGDDFDMASWVQAFI
jgi:mitogen-activated protein kinase kinase